MKEKFDGYLLDTNICVYYMNASAKPEKKWSLAQRQVFEKIQFIKDDGCIYFKTTNNFIYSIGYLD